MTANDNAEISKIYPDFCLAHLREWESQSDVYTKFAPDDFIFFPLTEKKKEGDTNGASDNFRNKFLTFDCSNDKYKDFLDIKDGVFFFDRIKDIPDTLTKCEELFDKNVLEIKKLVKHIGQFSEVTETEQLNLALYDDSNLIEETFVQRFNKYLQLFGFISIPFANTKGSKLITSNNLLHFRTKRAVQKEELTFELAYIEKTDSAATDDLKIHNLSIVCVEKLKKEMPIVEREVTIEGLQKY